MALWNLLATPVITDFAIFDTIEISYELRFVDWGTTGGEGRINNSVVTINLVVQYVRWPLVGFAAFQLMALSSIGYQPPVRHRQAPFVFRVLGFPVCLGC
jgi:hypothetical protein